MSEYRRQFERKTPTDNSPMLAAEKVIYNKNKLVPPFNINALKTETEYNSQFKGSPPAKGPKLRKDWEEKTIFEYEPEDFSHKRKDKKKKSNKPVSGLSNKDSPEAEIKQISQKRKHKEKVLQLLKHSYKSSRRIKSEYSENYLSPSAYQYRDGAWIRTKKQNDDQVKELREKAEYYRRRERGTHFSRDHLNQILSENNRLWDVSSNSSSEEQVSNNIKALDLAGFQASNNVKFPPPSGNVNAYSDTGNLGISDVPTLPVQRKLVWGENDVSEPAKVRSLKVEEKKTHASESEVIEVEEQMEQIKEHADSQQVKRQERLDKAGLDPLENDLEHTSEEGRLPTPKLKEFGLSLRTHHDRTTPSTGGALLVSPMKEQLPTPENSKKGSSERSTPFNKDAIKEYLKKQSKKETTSTSPHVAGIRTVDPIPLREDPWPNARNASNPSPPSFTTAVTTLSGQKPVVSLSQHWSPSCRIQGNLRHPEFQHNGSFGSTGYYSKLYSDDCSTEDDRLSQISERSVASSSLASQVLERAQRRKEHFWGKK
ncbi:hypothetical protein GDO86_005722 [Hymenochirus boettgeri]|nr:hypothetical protein GDO86_005722 [Hymenochirus boettgeri]